MNLCVVLHMCDISSWVFYLNVTHEAIIHLLHYYAIVNHSPFLVKWVFKVTVYPSLRPSVRD